MKNIFKIFSRDAKKIAGNVVALVIVMGLSIIPALYAWFNILSNWDPYGESATSLMKVAVYSGDEGLTLGDISLNIGDSVVEGLEANSTIGWVFCDTKEEALAGVYSGDYYAALILPEDFTTDMISFLSGDPENPVIEYYENSKKNAIATKITSKVKTTVQQTVNASFVSTLAEYASKAGEVLTGEGVETIEDVVNELEDIDTKLETYEGILESFATVTAATSGVLSSGQEILPDLESMVNGTSSALGSMQLAILAGSQTISSVATIMDYTIEQAMESLEDLQDTLSTVSSYAEIASSGISSQVEASIAVMDLALENFETMETLPGEATDYDEYNDAVASFEKLQEDLKTLETDTQKTSEDFSALKSSINAQLTICTNSLKSLQMIFDYSITPSLNQSVYDIEASLIEAQQLLGGVNGSFYEVDVALDNYESVLDEATANLEQTSGYIEEVRETLGTVIDALSLLEGDAEYEQILTLLQNEPDTIADYVTSPVDMETVTIYEIDGYGSAMAPFYTVLALWVGALIMTALVHVKVAPFEDLKKVRGHQEFFGRYITFFLIGQAQTLITVLGDLYYVQIQCLHPFLFWIGCAATSLVFTMIMYGLTVAFGNIGQALAVIIMVIQVAGAGCTFPIEVLPEVFQKIYQFLPFPYAMNLLKACVGGIYENEYWYNLGVLLGFGVFFCLIGVFLKKPFARLNATIEKSKQKSGLLL